MKKILAFTLAAMLLPVMVIAATLNSTLSVGTIFPAPGSSTGVSGDCTTAAANSMVTFALVQGGSTTQLGSPNNTTASGSGTFSSTVTFPSSFPAGTATLVATCVTTGDTINSPTLTFSAPVSSSLTVSPGSPTIGSQATVSGSCGSSAGDGSVTIHLTSGGSTQTLNTFNLSPTGTFSSAVTIPSSATAGAATMTANCSNGVTLTSGVTLGPTPSPITLNPAPVLGQTSTVSGNCTNIAANQNGTVTFAITRDTVETALPATGNSTNSSAAFGAQVTFPSSVGSGPATLIVTCPNGSRLTSLITVAAATTPTTPATTTTSTVVTTTPVGGVSAGTPIDRNLWQGALAALILASIAGFMAFRQSRRKNLSN